MAGAFNTGLDDFEDSGFELPAFETKALINLARKQRWEEVRNAVKNGADVCFTNKKGESALHTALWFEDVPLDVISMLIHPNIINTTKCGLSPLHIAAMVQPDRAIPELLRAGADPNLRLRGNNMSAMDLCLFKVYNFSLDASLLEELMPGNFNIDMLTILESVCLRYLSSDAQPQNVIEFQSVLRLLLVHANVSYPLTVCVQQIDYRNGSCFAVSSKPDNCFRIYTAVERWFVGTRRSMVEECEWHWIVQCLIKCGYTITFLPIIQQDPDAQTQQQQQQQHQVIRDIKSIYDKFKHQEEKEVAKLSDLCANVLRAHVQRPNRADKLSSLKFRQLKLPKQIVPVLTREDMADTVYHAIQEYRTKHFT